MSADGVRRPPEGALALVEPEACPEGAPEVALYVDGELGDVERTALESHLDECPRCRRAVQFEQAFRDNLKAKVLQARPPAASPELKRRIALALDHETPPAASPFAWPRKWFFRPVPVAAAGATALGLTAWLYFGNPGEDVVHDLVARHARRLPLEFQSNDPQVLESWLADKVDFHVHVPRIARPDLALLGARLSHVRDHSAVYLLYGNRQSPMRRVSMLVYDDPSGKAPPHVGPPREVDSHEVYTANASGYNVAVWKQDEIVYSLVSDGDDDVLDLVRAANR